MSISTRRRLTEAQAPLYVSIAGLLRNEIVTGKWSDGDRLPTIDQLADQFGVARVTVRQAIAMLVEDGLLSAQQGRGTFVRKTPAETQKVRLESNWEQLLGMLEGNKPRTLECIESTDTLPATASEGISTGDYRFMRRLHLQRNRPYCVLAIYLDRATYRRDPATFDSQMIIPNLRGVGGVGVCRMRQTFEIGSADLDLSAKLGVRPNAPVGLVRRVIVDADDRIIYLGIGQYRGDLVVFETTIDIPASDISAASGATAARPAAGSRRSGSTRPGGRPR